MAASTVTKTRRRARRAPHAPPAGVQRYRFTPDQFEQLARLGLFDHLRVELIAGEIVQMPPVGPEHSVGKTYTASAWQRRKQPKWHVRVDDPLRIGDSEPVPDVVIVPGKPSDYRAQHPTTAVLVIEIADTTREYDRTEKRSLYAAAGIPEYWIVNLVEGVLEVFREPAPMAGRAYGYGYQQQAVYRSGEAIAPVAQPEAVIAVDDLLPPREAE